ncbi:MAG: monofunctional biosynthetic peptidoglycan transglycosylase [Bacteroidota bacterium]|jgi:monofunctional biosynthetic peptidoglycan transglycosylase|nr:monofunctional biosynthetic peptidoglycan transglycosylase [Bacteroidota bacterium]
MEEVMGRRRVGRRKFWSLIFIKIPLAFVVISILWVLLLKWCPVLVTPLMIQRSIEYCGDDSFHTHKKWVSYENITPEMARAVIACEDNLFDKHNGFDTTAIQKARKEYKTGRRNFLRGASTISQQTAKNVFLLPSRSYVRKAFEVYFTILIERIWGKKRIMEVYLNVIETGKGLYGVEAAANHFFHTTAAKLTRDQCCLIAACLKNPIIFDIANPTPYVHSCAFRIRMAQLKLRYPDWIYHIKTKHKQDRPSVKKTSGQTRKTTKK